MKYSNFPNPFYAFSFMHVANNDTFYNVNNYSKSYY